MQDRKRKNLVVSSSGLLPSGQREREREREASTFLRFFIFSGSFFDSLAPRPSCIRSHLIATLRLLFAAYLRLLLLLLLQINDVDDSQSNHRTVERPKSDLLCQNRQSNGFRYAVKQEIKSCLVHFEDMPIIVRVLFFY